MTDSHQFTPSAGSELVQVPNRSSVGIAPARENPLTRAAFRLFIALTYVNLLSLPNRIPGIGYARPSLLLVMLITLLILMSREGQRPVSRTTTTKLLLALVVFVFAAVPFVEWPGSAVNHGIEGFLKAVVFFFFPLYLVDSYKRLKTLLFAFMFCQIFRTIEPLFLHLTTGYWGEQAYIGDGEFMDRLSGAPNDIIGPNGLAFVIMTVLPFLHYLCGGSHRKILKVIYITLLPVLLYTLLLTGSRSGMIGLVIVYLFIILRSRHRVALSCVAAVAVLIMVSFMDDTFKDRYLSLVSHNTRNSATSEGRVSGMKRDFRVGMRRPLVGHGIGTSREAIANFGGEDKVSHNLYTEVFIELGAVGLVIFVAVLGSIIRNVMDVPPAIRRIWRLAKMQGMTSRALRQRLQYYHRCAEALLVFSAMCIVFSFASYGLSEFYWYLTAGLTVSLLTVVGRDAELITRLAQATEP